MTKPLLQAVHYPGHYEYVGDRYPYEKQPEHYKCWRDCASLGVKTVLSLEIGVKYWRVRPLDDRQIAVPSVSAKMDVPHAPH